ncbi:MAG: hypothetical protein KBT02_13545 [Treponema sp.]|nr:hypothetical protein [Candidatus Treponema caballi]
MKKKIVTILVLALVVSTASVFALGIGAQGGYTAGGVDGALTIKPDGSNLIFAVNGSLNSNYTVIGITADDWLANKSLAKPINYFYGVGAAGSASIYDSGVSAGVYGRLFAGLNCFLLDNFFEIYLQAAWQPGIRLNIGSNDLVDPVIGSFPVNLGFRIWL